MAFPRPVDATLHGVTDYTVGTLLMTAFPRMAGIGSKRVARQIRRAGAAHLAYSTLTKYPLGIFKLIPFQMHLAIDAVGALAVAAMPFVNGQFKGGREYWMPHVGLCLFELSSLAITDPTGRGDFHGNVQRVHEANMENPHRKIYDARPAVMPVAA